MNIFEIEVINWRKLDTSKFWVGLFFTICHPFYAYKYDRDCSDSFLWRCNTFFKDTLPSYLPFSNACRWLTNRLIHNICDTKYLDKFLCRQRGDYTTYYEGRAAFGYYEVNKLYYKRCGNGYAKKPVKTNIIRGFCFTKRKAVELYKKIVIEEWDLYHSKWQPKPEVAHPWVMTIVENMKALLLYGKFSTTEYIDSSCYNDRFMKSKDKIEKLWCYVAHLLSCPNDFMAHEKLAWIFRTSDDYLYYKEMKTRPEIDTTYNETLKKLGLKEAKKWQNQQVKAHTFVQMHTKLMEQIRDLEDFYAHQPFDYYRV